MRKFRFLSAALVALAPSFAFAETITQTVPFDYDASFGVTFPVLQGFNTLGGARELTGVTFEFRNNVALDLYLESTGPTAVSSGDFSLDLAYVTLFQLGPADDKKPPPVFGPGAFFAGGITGDLAAYDGVPGNDGPDSLRVSLSDAFTSVQSYGLEEPSVLAAVTDVGKLETVFGGFTELFFSWQNDPGWPIPPGGVPEYPSDAAVWVSWQNFRHFGEIDVTYEYTNVPEPQAALGLGGLALVSALVRPRRNS